MADRKTLLTEDQIIEWLPGMPRWERNGATLHRELAFRDFTEAFGFLTMVALAAEKLDHHPDWSNSYATVVISLRSHDVGEITDRDIGLATAINAIHASG